jgi:hypothetical protein
MLPKDFLTFWAAKEAAEAAVDNWDIVSQLVQRDPAGAIDYLKNAHRGRARRPSTSAPPRTTTSSAWRAGRSSTTATSTWTSSRTSGGSASSSTRSSRSSSTSKRRSGATPTGTPAASTPSRSGRGGRRPRLEDVEVGLRLRGPPALRLPLRGPHHPGGERGERPVPEMAGGAVLHVRPEGWQLVPVKCDEESSPLPRASAASSTGRAGEEEGRRPADRERRGARHGHAAEGGVSFPCGPSLL